MTARLEVLGDDGEWREVPGITSVQLHAEEPEQVPTPLELFVEETRPLREAYVQFAKAYVEAARPIVEAAARGIEAYGCALRQAGLIDEQGRPVTRRDRPAWQSPYGPARRSR
ncbi:hypothetical protein OHB41_21110 [Streptomyces sp. NBC_01571]|uniref:hypothetical protein n=1 Tax=Streptomyces sp. NBC_01571 TaxID=2975883 RepID=UPI002255D7B4|nr:hypothetical protein [Streptomyces sp. NBC_01571]MCX4575644.1 hypothetical protein [Streptomyces sp. NBC_01571]